jgi:guanylate kinase
VSAIDYNNIYTAAFQKMVAEEAKMGNIEKTGRKYGVQVSWIQEWQRNGLIHSYVIKRFCSDLDKIFRKHIYRFEMIFICRSVG